MNLTVSGQGTRNQPHSVSESINREYGFYLFYWMHRYTAAPFRLKKYEAATEMGDYYLDY